jgi:hypothetical protein
LSINTPEALAATAKPQLMKPVVAEDGLPFAQPRREHFKDPVVSVCITLPRLYNAARTEY